MLPVIILVGLRMGVFTPTEAAVVAAVYALFVSTVVYRELSWKDLYAVFVGAAKTSAIVMFLIAAAMVSAWLITVADLPSKVVGLLQPFMGNQILLMIAIMVLVMIVGTAMDMTPTILILTPVLMPIVKAAGIDPVYFGVLFIINNSIGLVTPPVGTVLNVVAGVGKISMDDVTRGVVPFMIAEFAVMFLMVLFPWLVIGAGQVVPRIDAIHTRRRCHEEAFDAETAGCRRCVVRHVRRRCAGQGANAQVRVPEPDRPSAGAGRAEVRRPRGRQVGRQDHRQAVPGRRARRRSARPSRRCRAARSSSRC